MWYSVFKVGRVGRVDEIHVVVYIYVVSVGYDSSKSVYGQEIE